jgi:hypothetical protein
VKGTEQLGRDVEQSYANYCFIRRDQKSHLDYNEGYSSETGTNLSVEERKGKAGVCSSQGT